MPLFSKRGVLPGGLGDFRLLGLLLLTSLLFTSVPLAADPPVEDSAAHLTAAERRGKTLYRTGQSPSGEELTAQLGAAGIDVPAVAVPCVGCHGFDGRGRPEGGVTPSNVTWDNLTRPYGLRHDSGREHPPYDERRLKRAITMGVDPAGNALHIAMPRYCLSHEDAADLVAYLKRLGQEKEPGVGDSTLRLGVVLPPLSSSSPSVEDPGAGGAIRAVLEAYARRVNDRGGVYGRRLELAFIALPADPGARAERVAVFLDQEDLFALVAPFWVGAEEPLAALVEERELPVVGPFTMHPQLGFPMNRYVFYLYSGYEQQARALVDYGAEVFPAAKKVVVVAPDAVQDEALDGVAEAARSQGRKHDAGGWAAMERGAYSAAADLPAGTDVVLFLGNEGDTGAWLEGLAAGAALGEEALPQILLLSTLAGNAPREVPAAVRERILLAAPTLAVDRQPRGLGLYQELAREGEFSRRYPSVQLSALAAVEVLYTAVQQTGRDLTRERLVETLEGLYAFQTGLTPALTFGPNRRVGALGAYIARYEDDGRLLPVGGWVTPR